MKYDINSPKRFKKHKKWLLRSWGFCALIPLMPIGKWPKLGYMPYNIHHMVYNKPEIYGYSVIALNPLSHKLVHGFRRASRQKVYPNQIQKILHFWCRLHLLIKWFLIFELVKHIPKIQVWFQSFLN